MFCSKCGNEVKDGALFCSNCGAKMEVAAPVSTAINSQLIDEVNESPAIASGKPFFDDINWNIGDYPNANPKVAKTEDIDFNWGADPAEIRDRYTKGLNESEATSVKIADEVPNISTEPAELSEAEKMDKFYTFSKKNEEFQELLNREYEKIKSGNPIEQEQSIANRAATQRFENRPEDPSMEAFLEREGVVKPYQPKPFESDVLKRIEAQEKARQQQQREEEARKKALEEARIEAEAKKRAEEEARRVAEEAEAKRMAEQLRMQAEAQRRAEEQARRVAEEAKRADEEARRAIAEEAKVREEQRRRLLAEQEEARKQAEAQARYRDELRMRASQEAAKIQTQREAQIAESEKDRIQAEQTIKFNEQQMIRARLNETEQTNATQRDSEAAAAEVREALQQTARMREEEAAKIRAAVQGLKEINKPIETVEETPKQGVDLKKAIAAAANREAHQKTRDDLSGMAKAREEFLADFEEAPKPINTENATAEELLEEAQVVGRNTMLSSGKDLTATMVVDKNAILAGAGDTIRISKEDQAETAAKAALFEEAKKADEAQPAEEAKLEESKKPEEEIEDFLSKFDDNQFEEVNEDALEGFVEKEEPTIEPETGSGEEDKPGLDNTMVMPEQNMSEANVDSFDDYGKREAEEYKRQQEVGVDNNEALLNELPTEHEFYDDEEDEGKEEEKGGAGRVILKILLILLIVIFAAELAGIGIKFLAPNSKAAEIIDNQLNKVIHLITGQETNYDIPGIEYRV